MKSLIYVFLGMALPVWGANLSVSQLASVENWRCAADAPGGGFSIDAKNKQMCFYSVPGNCMDPNYSGLTTIHRIRLGNMHFTKGEVPFVEFLGTDKKGRVRDVKIYGIEARDHQALRFHAEEVYGVAVKDPNLDFEPDSNEIRCRKVMNP